MHLKGGGVFGVLSGECEKSLRISLRQKFRRLGWLGWVAFEVV